MLKKPNYIYLDRSDPYYQLPKKVMESLSQEIKNHNISQYSLTIGLPQLQEELVQKLKNFNNIPVDSSQILVTASSSLGLLVSFILCAMHNKGVILIPSLYYPPYKRLAESLNREYLFYPLNRNFLPDIPTLKKIIKKNKVSCLIINSPSNPTGATFPRNIINQIIKLSQEYNFYLISDEAYENYVYQGKHISTASLVSSDNILSVFSFSKTFALSGWRLGYVVLPKIMISDAEKLYRGIMINTSLFSQLVGLAILKQHKFPSLLFRHFAKQKQKIETTLKHYDVKFISPNGGLSFWIDVSKTGLSGQAFYEYSLKHIKVIVQPGIAFGEDGKNYIRMSFSGSTENAYEGALRLAKLHKILSK